MANKTIINSAPPRPSKRIIGGSNQRSKARLGLQNSHQWKYNHAPVDSDESKNATWWQEQAERYSTQLSSSGDNLYGRQAIKRELNRETDRGKLYNLDTELNKAIVGGSNQPFNKKYHLGDKTIGVFDTELNITDTLYPNTKKRVTFGVTIDGVTYNSEQAVPFSLFSSSISTGYQASLASSGVTGVAFNNLHDDKVQSYQGEIPMQGPFTERYVGGLLSRHNAALRSTERQESYILTMGPVASVASTTLTVAPTADPEATFDTESITVTINSIVYAATFDFFTNVADSTKSLIGIGDATDEDDVAQALVISLNAAATDDGLPIVASIGSSANIVNVVGTFIGTRDNGSAFTGVPITAAEITTSAFSGGSAGRSMNRPTVGSPQGDWLRGHGAKAPVNIGNIKTLFTSDSVRVVGNYTRNYEVFQSANRAATNMDLAYNTANYNYQTPSAFVTTPARRALGLTGSADYPAPRQIASRKTNQTIIANRFSAPGDKVDSKQQFRDVASDQFSSNNALPFRNLPVRNPYIRKLATHTDFGGFEPGSTTVASVHKTQRNQTQRVQPSGSTFVTGTVYDDYFVTRPIPAGDSTQWFFALSGSNTTTYSNYVLSGSRYPENISLSRTNIGSFDAGTGDFTWIDGNKYYIWSSDPYSAPWSQLKSTYKSAATYLKKHNLYELLPEEVVSKDSVTNVASTQARTSTDQGGNTITNFYSQQFREPPITSRYKPLVHQIETFIGSPSETTSDKITLSLEYSYGNSLMGFANRELNRQLAGDIKFAHNKVKRPYEALREQLNNSSSRSLNGVNMIKMFAYNETIFPREINTYLSGSRARLAFANSYWKSDADIETVTAFYNNFDTIFYVPSIRNRDNAQVPRLVAPFTTSQGFVVDLGDQTPYNPNNSFTPKLTGLVGSASMWPMDSYLWSSLSDTYAGASFETGSLSASVILAGQSTTACGELMMTHYGTVKDTITDSTPSNNFGTSSYDTSSIVSSQYVYSVAFETGTVASANNNCEPRIPGGAFSRPSWTAASERRFVDGESKGDLATQIYPFYNSYDEWAAELRLKGKSHTIIPEYRVSEHVSQFKTNRSLFTAISSSLEITGANANNFDGTNTDFYTRYATTDNMEFLSDFMSYDKGDVNFIFNDYPRHFEINSDAIVKLLPYDGFYPMNRTLEISTLFSQSYSPSSQFTGSEAGAASQWRALLRPYFAPGIMYNSIKSGVAVDYPIRRATRNSGQYDEKASTSAAGDGTYPGYKIGYPLFGGLYGELTGAANVSGTIPGNSRRNRDNFDWTDPDVNALYWADRLPFESILAPEDYLTAELGTTTGSLATVMSDINTFLHLDVTASFVEGGVDSNNLYKKAVSNFLANVPQFFLKTKENKFGSPGKLTKFVSQFGNPSKGSQEITAAARTVTADPKKAYMMEIGLMKTDQFNMYSNPAAFGPATNTSYIYQPWEIAEGSGSWTPSGSAWPKHRGEFAPFTPPYYYGPSLARITFMPIGDKKEYTLEEILNNDRGEVFIDFLNESGSYYDATSGSYVDSYGNTVATNTTPAYKWNRAWLNRMDIDASINIGNEFPTSAGSSYKSADPNKWTIMPKWESPVLDFPGITRTPAVPAVPVAYASASATMAAGLIADYNGLDLIIETSTVTVTFIFDSGSGAPSRSSATQYKVGYSGSSGNPEVAQALSASVALALSNAEIDVTPFVSDSLSPIVILTDNVGGTGINTKALTGDTVSLGYITQVPFAGGVDATPAVPATTTVDYNFSSSVTPSEFTSSAQGMWHQYGSTPDEGEGVYMYIKDIPAGEDEEYDLVSTLRYLGGFIGTVGSYNYVRKIPKYVLDTERTVSSLADLCGFDSEEVIRKGFDPKKAKRLGELAEDNENSISEAVVALPFYLDDNGEPKLITLQASPTELGPKIKEFRKNFTKYSLPPVLSQKLLGLVPKGYPTIADTINPFGGDEYDEILSGEDIKQIPVVYLMEHTAQLTKQDLADIWQGIMPDLARRMNFSFSAIDHYMPGDNVEETPTQFPEVLKEQINVGAVRDGNPRYDLLDIAEKACKQGFFPEIKWLVFKVKEKGLSTYTEMIAQEVDGPSALGYDNAKEFMTLQGLPDDQVDRILGDRDEFAKNAYISKHSLSSPTYNWPYDYCSLIESVKINSRVGFRPDLEKEYEEAAAKLTQRTRDEKAGNK
jgi:hypothetical protein